MNVSGYPEKYIEFSDGIKKIGLIKCFLNYANIQLSVEKKYFSLLKNYVCLIFLRLISIITPHYSEEIAQKSGFTGFLSELDWPNMTKNF